MMGFKEWVIKISLSFYQIYSSVHAHLTIVLHLCLYDAKHLVGQHVFKVYLQITNHKVFAWIRSREEVYFNVYY